MVVNPIALAYIFPIILALCAIAGLSIALHMVHRAGGRPDEDPAIRALHERRRRHLHLPRRHH